jgi:hypothetical protein
METPGKLSMEQEFKLKVLREQVKSLNLEQAQDYIVELLRQIMVKDNLVKQMIRDNLGSL